MAIENTRQFNDLYHGLGGLISPTEGISPSELEIHSLLDRIKEDAAIEVIFALATTVEGDTTNFYSYKQLKESSIKVSTLARRLAIGDEIEFADEVTLGRSIIQRLP